MAYDYAEDQDTALELIMEFGRVVEIQLLGAQSEDPAKPWEGISGPQPIVEKYKLPMAFVPASSASQLGLRGLDKALLKRFEQIAICGPGSNFTADLGGFTRILDHNTLWNIEYSETLRPGAVNVLYFFGVSR